jgi:hypothetical protein
MIPLFCDVAVDNSPGGNVEICLTRKGEEGVGDGGGEGVLGVLAGGLLAGEGVLAGGLLAGEGVLAGGLLAGEGVLAGGLFAGEGVLAGGGGGGGGGGGKKRRVVSQDTVTSAQLAEYFSVSTRQINRQIDLGMPTISLAAAERWRKERPSPHVPGVAKRQRLAGEVSAVAMAVALGISASRVHQLWKERMPRTVLLAKEWRAERLEQSSANPKTSVDFDEEVSVSSSSNPARSIDFDSDSSESSFGEGLDSCDSSSDTDIDVDVDILHRRSRNLSGEHSICPQLMDLCLAGIDCWGKFFTSFRPFEHKRLEFEPLKPIGEGLSHDEYLRLVLSIYKRYHKTAHPRDNSNSAMLERLRQVVGREKRHRQCPDAVADDTDKTDPLYQNRLLVARLATAAVRNGCATDEQQRMVVLKRNTEREYRDLDAFCRVNEARDTDYFEFFVPDLYKTGRTYSKHRADVKAERTVHKVEARRLAAVALGLGDKILLRHEVQAIVDGLKPRVMQLMKSNMAYIGITRFEEGGNGFNREVVRSFAVDGGCTPSLVVRDGSVVIKCHHLGCLEKLQDLGFRVEVLYRNMLVCNVRSVETGLHYAFWHNASRLWRVPGAGSYYNRPKQIQEQLEHAVIATVFIVYAPLTLLHRFKFASGLPLCNVRVP